MVESNQNESKNFAVVGGGISGLASAFYIKSLNPDANVELFESGSEESYKISDDINTQRASMGASTARMTRQMGHDDTSRYLIHRTFNLLENLQNALDNDAKLPKDEQIYTDIHGGNSGSFKLVEPRASFFISNDKDSDKKYQSNLQSLKDAGLREGEGYSQAKAETIKKLYPGLFEALDDNADILVENPYNDQDQAVSGAMNAGAILQVLIGEMKKHGIKFHFESDISQIEDNKDGKVEVIDSSGNSHIFDKAVIAPGNGIHKFIEHEKSEHMPENPDSASLANVSAQSQRVILADVDLKKLLDGNKAGIEPNSQFGVPLYKGAGLANSYGWNADSSDIHVKLYPAELVKTVQSDEELYADVNDDEKSKVAQAVIAQFGLEKLFPDSSPQELSHKAQEAVQIYSCQYVVPDEKVKRQLVMPANENSNIIVNALDSSSGWRIAGQGLNAAMQALEMQPPQEAPELYNRYGFAAHKELVVPQQETKANPNSDEKKIDDAIATMQGLITSLQGMKKDAAPNSEVTAPQQQGFTHVEQIHKIAGGIV